MFTRAVCAGGLAVPLLLMVDRPALAQQTDDETEARELAELEAAMAKDRHKTSAASGGGLNPDISMVLDTAFAWFTAEQPLQSGAHDPNGNGFTFQQLELDISSVVDPYFRLDAYLVFSTGGVEVEEAFGTTLGLPGSLQLRAGQFFSRFGRINSQHPHVWDFSDQPFMNGRLFSGEGMRGTGVELSWLTPLPWYAEIVASSTNPGGAAEHGDEAAEDDTEAHVEELIDLNHVIAVKQFFDVSDNWSLMWGASAALTEKEYVAGTDLFLKYRPITRASETMVALQVEAMARWRKVGGATFSDYGGYGQLVWRATRNWGLGARYEYGSDDEIDPAAPDDRHRVSVQASMHPTEYSRVRLQGGLDYPQWQSDPDFSVFLATEFIIGAHGAHKF